MERFMYHDDSFEHVLKQKADEYRMYPSDQSWENINRRLHKPNRFNWKAASFLTAGLLTISLWVSVHQHKITTAPPAIAILRVDDSNRNQVTASFTPSQSKKQQEKSSRKSIEAVPQNLFTSNQKSDRSTEHGADVAIEPKAVVTEDNTLIPAAVQPVEPEIKLTDAQELNTFSTLPVADFVKAAVTLNVTVPAAPAITETTTEIADESKTDADLNYEVHVPVSVQTRKPKSELQLHFTPSASYRVLVSDNRFNFGNLRDPNSAVKQRTSIGMEAGVTWIKPISKTVSFTAGLQFNFTNYVLVSSRYNPELATVILNSARNVQRYTNLRTSNGYFPENITNKTYQLSIPVGMQIRLLQTKKFSWNIGTSLQPTYLINATGYLVTNDYKNYIKAPEFLRNFNVNYSFESFLRFHSNSSTQIIAGPQFRYQLFSNSKENYPVQEHLVDYGFRIGIIKTFK